MQKIGLVTAIIIWLLLAGKIITEKIEKESTIVEAFLLQDFEAESGNVSAFGEYGVTHLTEEEKEAILVRLANSIGITDGFEITDDKKEETSEKILHKIGENADTTIKVITTTEDMGFYYHTIQYVKIDICFNNTINYVDSYRKLLSDVCEAEGIDANVTMNLSGRVPGILNYSEKNKLANELLKELDAEVVTESRSNDLFTVYAYSENIADNVICAGKKVNVNISESYDEKENMTIIYLSTPINNLDY